MAPSGGLHPGDYVKQLGSSAPSGIRPDNGEAGYWQTTLYGVYNVHNVLYGVYGVCVATTNQIARLSLTCTLERNENTEWNSGTMNATGTNLTEESSTESASNDGSTWGIGLYGGDTFVSGFTADTPNYPWYTYWTYKTV